MAGERVLVVDDEELIRQLLTRLCRGAGYQVVAAGDGAEALRALEEGFFNVCIVDLLLPGVDGMAVLRRAKELHPECEVIILTGFGALESAVEALRLGAYDYLEKPAANLAELIPITVSRALERQRLAGSNATLLRDLQRANTELELRRHQQLQFISYIGHAMSGALQRHDVTRVLIQAVLEAIGCDGVGVLLLHKTSEDNPWALTSGRKRLASGSRRALVEIMLGHLPEHLRPSIDQVETEGIVPLESEGIDHGSWGWHELRMLEVRDELEGVVVLANHGQEPVAEEAVGFLGILVTQGSVALANARLFARTRELATRDGLTGLYNHRHFFELLGVEISRAERYGQELAVIMLDIDRENGLKDINDTFGHQAGDELLRAVARFLEDTVRRADVVARYGGDEFVILAPQTGMSEAKALANRVRDKLNEVPFVVRGRRAHVTVSVGVAVFRPGRGESADTVVSLADRGLYIAKERGGNQVCMIQADGQLLGEGVST